MINNDEIGDFYRGKLNTHGASAVGVGWKDDEAQWIRFEQLIKVLPAKGNFSLNDLGCGTGDLIPLLSSKFERRCTYHGYDALPEMIAAARGKFQESGQVDFQKISGYDEMLESDYSVASGIFNVRRSVKDEPWRSYILDTISAMSRRSKKGFAFNALTSYSDTARMQPDLYYSDPLFLFDYCKRNFSPNVAVLHDYGIYDFTILVRKE